MTIVFSLLGAAIGAAIGDDEGFFAGIAIPLLRLGSLTMKVKNGLESLL